MVFVFVQRYSTTRGRQQTFCFTERP